MKSIRFVWCLALFAASTCFAQPNPVPFVDQPLVPAAVAPAGPAFTLTVNGAGFVTGSIVQWNGTALATTFASAIKLTAVVPAADVSTNGTARVTVVNPGPGGGSSDPVFFTITVPPSSLVFRTAPVEGLTMPINAVAADFNHDGIPDLAVIDQAPAPSCNYQYHGIGSISILLGNGDGTFSKHSTLCFIDVFAEAPQRLAVTGDLNRDGNVDLVAVSNGYSSGDQLDIYYGNGDGTFTTPLGSLARPAVAQEPRFQNIRGLAIGDFYSDGQMTIAVSQIDGWAAAQVFLLPEFYFPEFDFLLFNPIGTGAGPLAVGDFNRDGLLDLADGSGGGLIFLNGGNGVFTRQSGTPFGGSVATGDFNGDGIPDLAAVNGNSISVLLGKGDGTFTEKTGQPVSTQTNVSLITADVNGDGKLDLVVIDSTNTVSAWLGNGDGTFQAPVDTTGRGDGVVVADFNGDGRMDLAVANSTDNTVSILLQGSPDKALVEQPIAADGTSVFSTNRGDLPVKFSLTENNTPTCAMPPATIAITRTAGSALGSVSERVYATPADMGSNFRIDRSACQYVYNVADRSLGIGTYRVDISINGTAVGSAAFALQ